MHTAIKNLKVNLIFSFTVINCEYLKKLLLSLDEKKASGLDGISPSIAAPFTVQVIQSLHCRFYMTHS
jgi:hypothetical protein